MSSFNLQSLLAARPASASAVAAPAAPKRRAPLAYGALLGQINGGKLVLSLPLTAPRASTSGKAIIAASGGCEVVATLPGTDVPVILRVQVNAFVITDKDGNPIAAGS